MSSPSTFVPRRTGAKQARPVGALVKYTLAGPPALIVFTVERARGKRFVHVTGSLQQAAVTGRNSLCFTGSFGRRMLAPGSYKLVAQKRGGAGGTVVARFRIAHKGARIKNGCPAA